MTFPRAEKKMRCALCVYTAAMSVPHVALNRTQDFPLGPPKLHNSLRCGLFPVIRGKFSNSNFTE